MRVLHLVAGNLSGGAARGAYWLHLAQREIGIDSKLLFNGSECGDDKSLVSLAGTPGGRAKHLLLNRLGNLPVHLYRKRKRWIFNTGFAGVDFTKLPEYKEADVVHLHWINGLVATRTLRKVDKPIVWTLRDMWPLTGGCHYAMDCDHYTEGCGRCPQLQSKHAFDLSRLVVANKRRSLPKQIRLVGISQWLSECAASSKVFNGFPVQTISNNIDTSAFSPVAVDVARELLGIPSGKRVVLVGSQRVTDFYKGFDLFLQGMKGLERDDLHVVSFGRDASEQLSALGVSYTSLGFLADTVTLRLAYSCAEVFVAPSRMDAFGKTLAEAQACGTPVVCFDATGPADIVEHQVTGYKAEPFETNDLAAGIEWILGLSGERHDAMRLRSRERAVENFDSRVIARQYQALYQELLSL